MDFIFEIRVKNPLRKTLYISGANSLLACVIEQMPATTPDDFKLPLPSRQDMVDWVEEAYKLISSNKDMVMHSFDVCGITTSDPAKVRSGSFYEKCMRNAKSIIEANELEDEDPFEL